METLKNKKHFFRLIDKAIERFALDLTDLVVLTEAASGVFACTSLMAARSGADVIACTRDSRFGSANDVRENTLKLANELGVKAGIEFADNSSELDASNVNIVTNLGFVRPITNALISKLSAHSVICLMWEPWEIRPGEIDLGACKKYGIPVVGTNESVESLRTFEYIGVLAAKLLLNAGIEILGARILVVGSDPFGESVKTTIEKIGGEVLLYSLPIDSNSIHYDVIDAVVIAEHRNNSTVLDSDQGLDPAQLVELGITVVHICGHVNSVLSKTPDLHIVPEHPSEFGRMSFTTGFIGPRPVVDLHCAGLKVGQLTVHELIAGAGSEAAIEASVASGLGARIPAECFQD